MILQSLLEDGIRDSLPLQRVDHAWSPETLGIAMHLYSVEARRIQSPEETRRIQQILPDIRVPDLTSAEHTGQLRDGTAPTNFASLRNEVQHRDLSPTVRDIVIDIPKDAEPSPHLKTAEPLEPTGPEVPREDPEAQPSRPSGPAQAANCPAQPAADIARPAPKSVCKTMATLADHFAACKDAALAADSATWSPDIAHVFCRAVRSEDMTPAVARQRESGLLPVLWAPR
ncbi:hypothetical protein [Marinibacterium sp. SX1]|uniref:hypothetical protein n=1 Tax=Marinibacterium sp. SX1 TaxID=3388424 RepID=UPI003D174474